MPAKLTPKLARFINRLSSRADDIRLESQTDQLASIAYEDLHRYLGRRLNIGDVPISTVDGSSRYDRFEG